MALSFLSALYIGLPLPSDKSRKASLRQGKVAL
jgi:hypothetical protein